jgi:hypothetical protein
MRSADGVSWRHRDKSCLERVLSNRTAEGATARKRSGTRTADSRDLWRAIAFKPRSTEGEQRLSKARNLSGLKDRGAKHTGADVSYS